MARNYKCAINETKLLEQALPVLLEDLFHEPDLEWAHKCNDIALYYYYKQDLEEMCYYLSYALSRWPDNLEHTKLHFTDEIFVKIIEQQTMEFGLKLLRKLKDEFEPFAAPSRKGHQLLLLSLIDKRYPEEQIMAMWKEYESSNLTHSLFDYMCILKAAFDLDHKSFPAAVWFDKIRKMSRHGTIFNLMKHQIMILDHPNRNR
ncbi:hypothetical protein Tco_0779739 [Tanacetum coccineum]